MPRKTIPIVALVLCILLFIWQFAPFPPGFDPDNWLRFFGVIMLSVALFCLGLLGVFAAVRGERPLFLPLALLATPLFRFRAFTEHPNAGQIALSISPLFIVVVAAAIELRTKE